jgi:hypothetical protein
MTPAAAPNSSLLSMMFSPGWGPADWSSLQLNLSGIALPNAKPINFEVQEPVGIASLASAVASASHAPR